MAVVRNLMVRIGADYSPARKAMQGATRELTKFKNDTTRTTSTIRGKKGLGGISSEFKTLGTSVAASLSQIRGAKGIGGVVAGLGTLTPALRSASGGFKTLAASAGGASRMLGPIGIGAAALTAVLTAASAGLYAASQQAVKFEADIGRLNMQLKGNAREFMDWAASVGLAKTQAVEMGATFSTLLSSFIKDNQSLAEQTKQLTQTSRVVASATGRSIEDVMERMRSGLLGNTEAINSSVAAA